MEMGRMRGRTWAVTVDFIETLAYAIVVGALASAALAGVVLVLSLSANAAEGHAQDAAQAGPLVPVPSARSEVLSTPVVTTVGPGDGFGAPGAEPTSAPAVHEAAPTPAASRPAARFYVAGLAAALAGALWGMGMRRAQT